MTEETGAQPLAVCVHLRTKKMYYQDGTDAVDLTTDTHPYYWCLQTMNQIGPDDGLVALRHCQPGRACFEGLE
jgi:hypothetical protein